LKGFFKEKPLAALLAYWPYVFSALVILRSRPFLRLPYDMWHHLMLIRGWYQDGEPILTKPGSYYHEVLWHRFWAALFKFIHVSDVFTWAKIIHCTQFMWTLFCVSYFCLVILKYSVEGLSGPTRRNLAMLGAWCFIFGAGTFSVQYQLSWMLWYGVNYQGCTLPAFFLAGGLLLDVLLTDKPRVSLVQIFIMVLVFCSMVAIHPLESSYFLIVLLTSVIFFFPEIRQKILGSPLAALLVLSPFLLAPLLLYMLPLIGVPLPRPSGLVHTLDLNVILQQLFTTGTYLQVHGLHRGLTTFNELAITGCILLALMTVLAARKHKTLRGLFNQRSRVLMFILFLAVGFALLPRLTLTSGVLALLTVDEQVWRFSFASPWFVGFTLWGSAVLSHKISMKNIALVIAPIIVPLFVSRFISSGPFNTTAASVIRSLELIDRHKVGIQFDKLALKKLEDSVLSAPHPQPPRKNIFIVRSDLQTYVRAATGAYVVGDRLGTIGRSSYDGMPDKDQYDLIIIDPPSDIPVDQEMAKAFPSMGLPLE
jgi:hypothetical protein